MAFGASGRRKKPSRPWWGGSDLVESKSLEEDGRIKAELLRGLDSAEAEKLARFWASRSMAFVRAPWPFVSTA